MSLTQFSINHNVAVVLLCIGIVGIATMYVTGVLVA